MQSTQSPALCRLLGALALFVSINDASFGGSIDSAGSGAWSAPSTWVNGQVPSSGDAVRVRSGHAVVYDVNSAAVLESVLVNGSLLFRHDVTTRLETSLLVLSSDAAFDMQHACAVHVHEPTSGPRPRLQIGTPEAPVQAAKSATVRLHPSPVFDANCAPALISQGGDVVMHGNAVSPAWTKLAVTAPAGATQVTLAAVANWSPGQRIIIVGTFRPPGRKTSASIRGGVLVPQTEARLITAVSPDGRIVDLDQPLLYGHAGGDEATDRRGEVANLSRNIVIESADASGIRGHTMFHRYSAAAVSHVEFRHLGKEGVLGRYPLHFHLVADSMRGSFVDGVSIWDSANRWISVHGAEFLVIRNTVGFGSVGHGFFLENGAEVYNLLEGNLGVQAYIAAPLPNQALAYDQNRGACYWAANARNFVYRNVFAECDNDMSFILEYDPNDQPMWAPMLGPDGFRASTDIRSVSGGLIDGLEVHSTWGWGPWIRDATYPESAPLLFRNTRVWRTHYSTDISGDNVIFDGVRMLDSPYGFYNRFPGPHLIRNASFDSIGPHGAFMTYLGGHGTFLYENIQLARSTLAFRMDAKQESGARGQPIIHHVRNITNLTPAGSAWVGTEGSAVRSSPLLLLVHHDAVAQGVDRYLMPTVQSETLPGVPQNTTFIDATGITDANGIMLEGRGDSKYSEGSMDWPDSPLSRPVDSLPPATVILKPREGDEVDAPDGMVEVCGVALDQGGISSVVVNGRTATIAPNGHDWCAALTEVGPGPLPIQAAATDTFGNFEVMAHTLRVILNTDPVPPLGVSTTLLPNGRVKDAYSYPLSATGGVAPYTWSRLTGELPPGLSLASTGVISGTPSEYLDSPYVFTVQATDSVGTSTTRQLSIVVADCDCNSGGGCH